MSSIGYFDLAKLNYSERKQIFKNIKINLPDSIIKNGERIYHSPPYVEYFNENCLLTNSTFGIIDKSKKPIWKSEYLTAYDCNSTIIKEVEINQELYSTKCISDDGRYLFLVQVRPYQTSEIMIDKSDHWAEDNSNDDYDLPLKLIDLENGKQTFIKVDFRKQPVTDMKYINGIFHAIFGDDTHVIVDVNNRKAYSKYYNERINEPLLYKIERQSFNLSQYQAYGF